MNRTLVRQTMRRQATFQTVPAQTTLWFNWQGCKQAVSREFP